MGGQAIVQARGDRVRLPDRHRLAVEKKREDNDVRKSGQSLGEYGLAIALLAILGVTALTVLGGNIRSLFLNAEASLNPQGKLALSMDPQKKYQQTNGTPPFTAAGSSLPVAAGSHSAGDNRTFPDQVTLSIDPQTGQLKLADEASGGGKNSTSVDGGTLIAALADRLNHLVDFKTPDGETVPSELQTMLHTLSIQGSDMGTFYQDFQKNKDRIGAFQKLIAEQTAAGQLEGPPYYSSQLAESTIQYADNYIHFAQIYGKLAPQIDAMAKQNPDFLPLQQDLANYAGALSATTHHYIGQGFLGSVAINRVNPSDLATGLQKNPHAAPYFQQLSNTMASLPPAQRNTYFQKAIVGLGASLQVGTPVVSESPLKLALK